MRIPRIYCPAALSESLLLSLDTEIANYIGKVLRMSVGDRLSLFNGQDGEFSAELVSLSRHSIEVRLGVAVACQADPALHVHIGLGLSRGERMDYAVQKATELGVAEITPLFSERCEVKLAEDRAGKRLQHWRKVAISACEQSGRCQVPQLHAPVTLGEWLQARREGGCFVLDQHGSQGFPRHASTFSQITLLSGPEGGLTEQEVAQAEAAGFIRVKLGARILRTETAPLVALSLVQHLWGDF